MASGRCRHGRAEGNAPSAEVLAAVRLLLELIDSGFEYFAGGGLLDPTGGQVLLNGEDIRDFNRRDYYRLFSTVFQDFSVFDTTFADNVTQAPESPDTAGMEDAVKRAGLWEKYQSLPQGGATHIGQGIYEDGLLLSGGELQRVTLAQALDAL